MRVRQEEGVCVCVHARMCVCVYVCVCCNPPLNCEHPVCYSVLWSCRYLADLCSIRQVQISGICKLYHVSMSLCSRIQGAEKKHWVVARESSCHMSSCDVSSDSLNAPIARARGGRGVFYTPQLCWWRHWSLVSLVYGGQPAGGNPRMHPIHIWDLKDFLNSFLVK